MRKLPAAAAIVLWSASVPGSAQTPLDEVGRRIAPRGTAPAATAGGARTSESAGGPTAAESASAFPLDVAGIRLGMPADVARSALTKAGYSIPATDGVAYGPSFGARVRAEAARRRGAAPPPAASDRVVTRLQAEGPNREAITVGLAAAPAEGSAVVDVRLRIPQEAMGPDAFLRQATARYGRPDGSRDQGMTLAWCSPPLRSVCASITPSRRRPEALPNLTASVVYDDNTISLRDGTERDRERERVFAAAVERAAPKTDRAAF